MTDHAAEAAFERWMRENHPLSVGVHAAFAAGFVAGCAAGAAGAWAALFGPCAASYGLLFDGKPVPRCERCGVFLLGDAKHECGTGTAP